MRNSALIIGNGSAGLLLALVLTSKGHDVSIVYRPSGEDENSALICSQLVIDFLQELSPGTVDNLRNHGARIQSHSELLRLKFPEYKFSSKVDSAFLFVSRRVLIGELSLAARAKGVKFIPTEVTGLQIENERVTGILTPSGAIPGHFIFDCTGSPRARREWMKDFSEYPESVQLSGIEEDIFQRFYRCASPPPLLLRSLPECRGGIYPVEGNDFVLNLSCPTGLQSTLSIDSFATGFISLIGGDDLLKQSTPQSEWKKITKRSYKTDYYDSPYKQLRNFYPIGDGLLCSHPVYGRGISLVILQISPLLQTDEVNEALEVGYESAEMKWKEVASENDSPVVNFVKRYALGLLEKDPVVYEQYLAFYQLRSSPLRLALGLMLSPLRRLKPRTSRG